MSHKLKRLNELCERLVEERITDSELAELEEMVLRDSEAKTYYNKYVRNHVALIDFFETYRVNAPAGTPKSVVANSSPFQKRNRFGVPKTLAIVAATLLIVPIFGFFLIQKLGTVPSKTSVEKTIAISDDNDRKIDATHEEIVVSDPPDKIGPQKIELETAEWGHIRGSARWSEDSNAVRDNHRIGPGRLQLHSGMMTIYFDHGVVLTIESPSCLEITSPQRCFLHSGRVFAKVSPEATGFTVDTSVAEIKDLGTEFGVSIREGDADGHGADVHVFSGRVDVTPKGKEDYVPLTTGGWLRFRPGNVEPLRPQEPYAEPGEGIACSTASKRGREACVVSGGKLETLNPSLNSASQIFTLIKNGLSPEWNRKGYFSIDLSSLSEEQYRSVRLELTFAPTGVGAFSYVPEQSEFSVYGLTDESQDDWNESTVSWQNAPAAASGAAEVDPEKAVKIDSFEIRREEEPTRIVIENEKLKKFLSTDTNKIVTFIVVRDTVETASSGHAHGFANRHHPKLPPPTLRFFR